MMDVLWLPSWHPSAASPQNGDFIFRHADCVSRYSKIVLLFSHSVSYITDLSAETQRINDNLVQTLVLFPVRKRPGFVDLFRRFCYYNAQFRHIYKHKPLPEIVHVHVSYRAGLFALWLKWRYGLKYVITEHWSFFTKERKDNYLRANIFMKLVIKLIFKNAAYVLPVSRHLENQLKCFFPSIESQVIPNVVSPDLFFVSTDREHSNIFKFIHVSSLSPLKNPLGIIRTFAKIKAKYADVILEIVGNAEPELIAAAQEIGCSGESLIFHGVKEHADVAALMRGSNAFILFSEYETQSCVSVEALSCGLPVVSSRLSCIEEFITDENGVLVPPGDEDALFRAMESMILHYSKYDRRRIAETAQAKYNPDIVAKQIVAVYEQVLNKK